MGKGAASEASSGARPVAGGAASVGGGNFTGRWGKKTRVKLCVTDLAASHEICCPMIDVTSDLNGLKGSAEKHI